MPTEAQIKLPPEAAEALAPFEHLDLIEDDGVPLETSWHRWCMNLLIASVLYRQRDGTDFYVGGNMFIYFSLEQARSQDFRGPDFFVVQGGVNLEPARRYWAVWDEGGRYPDIIIELLSRSTAELDRTVKKKVYEQTFRTPNYYCYEPASQKLEGWELVGGRYEPLRPNEYGRLWSSVLGLWVGTWEGEYLRQRGTWLCFFDEKGEVVPVEEEALRRRVDEQQRRAEAAEAEVMRLRTLHGAQGRADTATPLE
jgi:Uma2 family endonuclease